ncbi:MAG: hypothetical protein K2N03_02440 [Muribaculaceae bacterium]|nr:hypothetical protein [Muribaculaceae bacterium]
MKKLLLFAGLAAAALSVNAQDFSEYFEAKYDNKVITDGSQIICSERDEFGTYHIEIPVTNNQEEARKLYAAMLVTGNPSIQEIKDDPTWGMCQLCYESEDGNQCLPADQSNPNILGCGTVTIPAKATLTWDIHNYFSTIDQPSTYKILLVPYEEDEETDAILEFTIRFDIHSGIEGVAIDENLPVEYFDLAGRKVANPEKGIYILRQGNKTVKKAI